MSARRWLRERELGCDTDPDVLAAAELTLLPIRSMVVHMATTSQIQKNLRNAMKEALRIQDRFVAEPLFAKTGRGHLKSEGVATLQKIKANLRRRPSSQSK